MAITRIETYSCDFPGCEIQTMNENDLAWWRKLLPYQIFNGPSRSIKFYCSSHSEFLNL
jgi:hypothetical protein